MTGPALIAALLAPLPPGEDFDAQAFLDQCAADERVTLTPRVEGFKAAMRYLAERDRKGGAK